MASDLAEECARVSPPRSAMISLIAPNPLPQFDGKEKFFDD
jgi:hypothetical protein